MLGFAVLCSFLCNFFTVSAGFCQGVHQRAVLFRDSAYQGNIGKLLGEVGEGGWGSLGLQLWASRLSGPVREKPSLIDSKPQKHFAKHVAATSFLFVLLI